MLQIAPPVSDAKSLGFPTSLDAPETSSILPAPSGQRIKESWEIIDALHPAPDPKRPDREHPLEVQSGSQRIIHEPFRAQRWSIVNALNNGPDELRRRARRLGLCASTPTLRYRDGEIYPCLQRCRDRLCPLCATHRGREASKKAEAATAAMNAPRFITLTTRANGQDLLFRMRHLISSFNVLRRTPEWREWVKGGIYALEVTYNRKHSSWHPHLHIIADGEFIPHAKLKSLWSKITRDSHIVDVRAVHDRAKAARYIATYVAKPFDVSNWPPEAIREYAEVLHGARMIQGFGSCFNTERIDADDIGEVPEPSRHLVHGALVARFSRTSKSVQHAREIIARMGSYHAVAVETEPVPSAAPVEEWERKFASAICGRLTDFLIHGVPPDFDLDFTPARFAAAELPGELAPGDKPDYGGQGNPDPHQDAADPCTLFEHHGDSNPAGR